MEKIIILMLLFSSSSFANSLSGKEGFCQDRSSNIRKLTEIRSDENRLAFGNAAGGLGIGLCWWVARLQRHMTETLVFEGGSKHYTDCPLIPRNDLERLFARTLNHQITHVQCFNNLHDFTLAHKNQLLRLVSDWQVQDTYNLHFILGLKGSPRIRPEKLAANIEEIYHLVKVRHQITYAMLQLPGVASHAWLVIDVVRTNTGFILDVLDSNFPKHILRVEYKYGNGEISLPRDLVEKIGPPTPNRPWSIFKDKGPPYSEFALFPMYISEGYRLQRAALNYCSRP